MQCAKCLNDEPRPDSIRGIRNTAFQHVDRLTYGSNLLDERSDRIRRALTIRSCVAEVALRHIARNHPTYEQFGGKSRIECDTKAPVVVERDVVERSLDAALRRKHAAEQAGEPSVRDGMQEQLGCMPVPGSTPRIGRERTRGRSGSEHEEVLREPHVRSRARAVNRPVREGMRAKHVLHSIEKTERVAAPTRGKLADLIPLREIHIRFIERDPIRTEVSECFHDPSGETFESMGRVGCAKPSPVLEPQRMGEVMETHPRANAPARVARRASRDSARVRGSSQRPSVGSTRLHSTDKRSALSPISRARSKSPSASSHQLHACPTRSPVWMPPRSSQRDHWLRVLPPSNWCAEVETPHTNPGGNTRSPFIGLNTSGSAVHPAYGKGYARRVSPSNTPAARRSAPPATAVIAVGLFCATAATIGAGTWVGAIIAESPVLLYGANPVLFVIGFVLGAKTVRDGVSGRPPKLRSWILGWAGVWASVWLVAMFTDRSYQQYGVCFAFIAFWLAVPVGLAFGAAL